MSGIATTALVAVSAWLLVLNIIMVLVVRQIALLTLRLATRDDVAKPMQESHEHHFDVTNDGPRVGYPVAEETLVALPEAREIAHVLVVSATCVPCRKLVVELRRRSFREPVVVLLSGRESVAAGMAALLPPGVRIIRDPDATNVSGLLNVHSTPFAVSFDRGVVVAKTYLEEAAAFIDLIEAEAAPVVALAGASGGN